MGKKQSLTKQCLDHSKRQRLALQHGRFPLQQWDSRHRAKALCGFSPW